MTAIDPQVYAEYPPEGLSIKEYAAHRKRLGLSGVNYRTVRKALDEGRIYLGQNGRIDPRQADEDWSKNTNPNRDPLRRRGRVSDADQAHDAPAGIVPPIQESSARKEHAMALLKETELAKLRGDLIRRDVVYEEMFNIARMVREQVLAVPVRVAPMVASQDDPIKVEHLLENELRKALERLADGVLEVEGQDESA